MATIPRLPLDSLVLTRLRTLTGVVVYDGEVDSTVDGLTGTRSTPPMLAEGTRVAPYIVYYPSWGTEHPEQALCQVDESIDWPIQLTCVAGFRADVRNLADRVNALLFGWAVPASSPLVVGPFRPPLGYNAPLLRETSPTSERYTIPLQYTATIGR